MKRDELLAFIDTRLDAAFGELGAALAAETDDPDVAAAIPLHMFPASMMPMRQAEALVRGAVELWRLGRQVGGDDA